MNPAFRKASSRASEIVDHLAAPKLSSDHQAVSTPRTWSCVLGGYPGDCERLATQIREWMLALSQRASSSLGSVAAAPVIRRRMSFRVRRALDHGRPPRRRYPFTAEAGNGLAVDHGSIGRRFDHLSRNSARDVPYESCARSRNHNAWKDDFSDMLSSRTDAPGRGRQQLSW